MQREKDVCVGVGVRGADGTEEGGRKKERD